MSPKKPSPRSARRARDRAAVKLGEQRERLARLEAGGAPGNPLRIESASLVEIHARSVRCLRCDGPCRLDEHAAEAVQGVRLRVARVACAACGARRSLYFQIVAQQPN